MDNITIEALVNAGVHFGHPTSKWHPNFKPYIAMKKNGIHIIDLEQTQRQLEKASKEITKLVRDNGTILFVGTKKQAKDVIQLAADRCGMFYVVERWLGGTLTNFSTIKKSIKRLLLLEKESSEIYTNLTKKEMGLLERERIKLGDLHRGIKDMKYLPSAIFFVDGMNESTAIKEATRLGIPTFGIVDSNTDPTPIDFPIPANDDSLKSIHFVVNYIADVIIEGRGGVVESKSEISVNELESIRTELLSDKSADKGLDSIESAPPEPVQAEKPDADTTKDAEKTE
ncbi:MAG: 30S ribosomal protein S2 [Candidatus Marinimicrobia bacterium]|nr:30S ribosomal protein S2 [Candidatus Neomarinimicrobiota bacterium]